jgi:hypothetical protein
MMSVKYVTILFIISIIQHVGCQVNAQETKNDTIKKPDKIDKSQDSTSVIAQKPATSLYIEIFGKVYLSINVDLRITKASAISFGVLPWKDNFAPNLMYYHFFGNRHRIELGGGTT